VTAASRYLSLALLLGSAVTADRCRAEPPVAEAAARPTLAAAPDPERHAIEAMRKSSSWVRRAFACERLARFDCEPSAESLRLLVADPSWQVRCYAILACARRNLALPETQFANEDSLRVVRTALRARFDVPKDRLLPVVERLERSDSLEDRMMALELALAGDLDEKRVDRDALLQSIVMRMDRVETGSLSPRLAAITGGSDSGRSYRWREWYRKNRKNLGLDGGFVVAADPRERDRGPIAEIPSEAFVSLEKHVADLSDRELDIAIVLDCTASMSGEIAECQSGIDALMLFAQGVARDIRVAVVGYRDRRDKWETQAFDFTSSLQQAREHLWMLSAEGGGDRPESVSLGLKVTYGKLSWRPGKSLFTVLVGDAPPHPGTGEQAVEYAKRAFAGGVKTYCISPFMPVRAKPPAEPTATPAPEPELDPTKPIVRPDGAPPVDIPDPTDAPAGPQPWFKKRRPKEPVSPWRKDLAPGEVEYFAEIAEAGGGRAVTLPRDASLIAEIAGITLGDAHRDEIDVFFAEWMALCR
jgi:hypothetical protein